MRHLNGWRERRRRRSSARQLHLALGELSAHVRAGRSLAQAVAEVAGDMPEPIRGSMREAAEAIAVGTSPGEALGALAGDGDGALLAAAIAVQARAGGDLAALLDDLADALVEREAQRRLAAGITAQARATARTVACMPLAALAGLWLLDGGALQGLLAAPLGWAALALSGGMTLAGVLMIRRIAAAVT
jgi:tight adherence protein B